MPYSRQLRVEFNHCDPAGIVFFARYYEMFSSVFEGFFRDVVGYPFEEMILKNRHGVPTVRVETSFKAPSRLGDVLDVTLSVVKVGRSSLDFELRLSCRGEERLTSAQRIVYVTRAEGKDRALPWPDRVRAVLEAAAAQTERRPETD